MREGVRDGAGMRNAQKERQTFKESSGSDKFPAAQSQFILFGLFSSHSHLIVFKPQQESGVWNTLFTLCWALANTGTVHLQPCICSKKEPFIFLKTNVQYKCRSIHFAISLTKWSSWGHLLLTFSGKPCYLYINQNHNFKSL